MPRHSEYSFDEWLLANQTTLKDVSPSIHKFKFDIKILNELDFNCVRNPDKEGIPKESGCVENWSRYWYQKLKSKSIQKRIYWTPLTGKTWTELRIIIGGQDGLCGYVDSTSEHFLVYDYNKNRIWKVYQIEKHPDFFHLVSLPSNTGICENCFNFVEKHKLKSLQNSLICLKCWPFVVLPCCSCGGSFLYPTVFSSQTLNIQTLIKVEERIWMCSTCAPRFYNKCHRCRKWVKLRPDIISGMMLLHDWYCLNCGAEIACSCQECGTTVHIDNTMVIGSRRVCRNCGEKNRSIKQYNYIPKFKFSKLRADNSLYLGVELEVETNSGEPLYECCATTLLEFIKSLKLQDYYYIKHDGTVKGFELVCHPATMAFMHKHYEWQKILQFCVKQGWTSYLYGHCGLHVHLNREFFSPQQKRALRLFFSTNSYFLSKFGKREGINMRYCQYEDFAISDFIRQDYRQENKYYAYRTNPEGKNTVEMRIFRGTLNYDRFLATLQFCDALGHFVKGCSLIICGSKKSWIEFINWTKQIGRYVHFIKYIQDKNKLLSTET